MDFILHLLTLILIYGILAISLNLVTGYLGILSIAHGALFGVAAYALSILTLEYQMPFWPALLIGGIVSSCVGVVIAIPCLKLKGDYLALATFGFAVVAFDIFNNWVDFTGGPMGLSGVHGPNFLGIDIGYRWSYFLIVSALLFLAYLTIWRIASSPWGRTLQAIRDEEIVVELSGRDCRKYRLVTFAFSAFWAGIAGGLYVGYINFIHPSNFTPMLSILILCMVILGGLGSFAGSLLGAFILLALPEGLRFLNLSASLVGSLNQIIYGAILVLIVVLRPQGLLGKYKFIGE